MRDIRQKLMNFVQNYELLRLNGVKISWKEKEKALETIIAEKSIQMCNQSFLVCFKSKPLELPAMNWFYFFRHLDCLLLLSVFLRCCFHQLFSISNSLAVKTLRRSSLAFSLFFYCRIVSNVPVFWSILG